MAAGDLTTLEAAKQWLGIDTADSDTQLQSLVTALSVFVQSELNRQILTNTVTETRQGNGKNRFQLRQWPVQSITKVEWAGAQITTAVDAFGTASGVATDGRSLILIGYRMPYGSPVRITYVAGWHEAPSDLAQVVTELVGEAYTSRTHIGETSHSSNGQTTVSFDRRAMAEAIRVKLDNYMPGAPLC